MISVIVPIYNVEKYLEECLNSILSQTYKDFEIICINDDSTDSSRDITYRYMLHDSRVKLIDNSKNLGLASTRNVGIKAAKGKYILFVDSDDYLSDKQALEKLYNLSERDDLDLVNYGAITKNELIEFKDENSFDGKKKHIYPTIMNGICGYLNMRKTGEYRSCVWLGFYKLKLLKDNGIFFLESSYSEDIPFTFDVLLKTERMRVINDNLYCYRLRDNSLVHSKSSLLRTKSAEINIMHLFSKMSESELMDEQISIMFEKEYQLEIDFWKKRFDQCSESEQKSYIDSIQKGLIKKVFTKDVLGSEYYLTDECLKNLATSKVYLYGAGDYAKKYLRILDGYGISIYGVVVSKNAKQKLFGYSVQCFENAEIENNAIILPAVSDKYKNEVLQMISTKSNLKIVDLENYRI